MFMNTCALRSLCMRSANAMHNKSSLNRTVKKLRILPSGYVQRWASQEKS